MRLDFRFDVGPSGADEATQHLLTHLQTGQQVQVRLRYGDLGGAEVITTIAFLNQASGMWWVSGIRVLEGKEERLLLQSVTIGHDA